MRKRKLGFYFVLLLIAACFLLVPAFAADGEKHWWDAFSWFGEIANFIKSLVVPPANYWHNRLMVLNNMINAKFAGLGQLYRTLDDFFRRLSDPAAGQLVAIIPDDFLFRGYRGFSMDFFGAAAPYIRFMRTVLSASCFLATAAVCYHKVRTFFTEEA